MRNPIQAVLLLLIGIFIGVYLSAMFPNELHAPFVALSAEQGRHY